MKNYPQKLLPALAACLLALALCACSAGQGAGNDPAEESAQAETNAAPDASDTSGAALEEDAGNSSPAEAEDESGGDAEAETETGDAAPAAESTEGTEAASQEGNTAANAGGETPAAQEPADESGQTEEPQEAPPAEEPAQSEPVQTEPVQTAPEESASEDAVQTGTSQVDNAPAPETGGEDLKAIAEGLVGRPVSELYAAIGNPLSSSYAPSCLVVDGEDGELIYDGFIVYTEKGPDYETVYAVF